MFADINFIFCVPCQAKATAQPDKVSKPAEPDPAEMWKKDFKCQWYKTADGEISDSQSPKDGAPLGGKSDGKNEGMVATSTVSTTKGATETVLTGSDLPDTGSPTTSLKLSSNSGTNPLTAPNLYILLLGAVSLSLGP